MEIELIRVEAIETPEGGRGTWNSFCWQGKINGKTYGMVQEARIDYIEVQWAYDQFEQKKKELGE